jgi:tRNA(Ile)-lysidine synthase
MLPDSFLILIKERNLFSPNDKLLLAVSGGIDSVVLTHLISTLPNPFAIAHCNFGLRGDESSKDEDFVRKLAEVHKVDFFVQHFQTKYYAEEEGISTQMAARGLRYAWLERVLQTEGYSLLLTAHHLSDSLETSLMNFTRGTGVRGLRGIKVKSGNVIRPLLTTTRHDIEVYARENDIQWREDSSNAEDNYTRNFFRHQIIPRMKEINPALEQTFDSMSRRLRDADQLIMETAEVLMREYSSRRGKDWFISLKAFSSGNLAVAEEIFRPFGLNISQVRDLIYGIKHNKGTRLYLSKTHQINVDRKFIIISRRFEPASPETEIANLEHSVTHSLGTFYFDLTPNTGQVHRQPYAVSVDQRMIHLPLKIRKWKEGDTFQPLGMTGKKKVSDFMIDAKIPLNLKERVYVMESEGEIVWVIGYRLDERYKVTKDTQRILHISLEHDQSL